MRIERIFVGVESNSITLSALFASSLALVACGSGNDTTEMSMLSEDPVNTTTELNSGEQNGAETVGSVGNTNGSEQGPQETVGTNVNPSVTPPPEELVATWASQSAFGSFCVIKFSFNSDYTFSSEAADERRNGFYTVDATPNAERRRRLDFTFTSDNGLPNCFGSSDVETGQAFVQWVELNGLYMGWFDGPDAGANNVRDWSFSDGAER